MFKQFLIESEKSDLKITINKLPKEHQKLVSNYSFKFQGNNTLKGDNENVGELDPNKKKITIASPWNYPREITVLHEIGHLVWEKLLTKNNRNEWSKILNKLKQNNNKSKKDLDQNDEEIFCHSYAQFYIKNKMVKFDYPELQKFISKLSH